MWQGILGHDAVVERFRAALSRGRLASTYLFVGPEGIGKRAFAERLAAALLCSNTGDDPMSPCGTCGSCTQVASLTHPDLLIVERPPDKNFIPLSSFIGDDQHRMRQGLCHDLALKPFMGGRKVAIIDDADDLNEESANALLKTLEEPPPRTVLILIGTSAQKQLPTIRSRSQLIRFAPLERSVLVELLLAQGLASDSQQASHLAELADGSLSQAVALADDELRTFRERLLGVLPGRLEKGAMLAAEVGSFVEAAGKEATRRRERARQVVGFAVDFYRQELRAQCGLAPQGDRTLIDAARRAVAARPNQSQQAAAAVDRSLEALAHIDRNAHQTTLLECWLDDLARLQD